jgi:hypothetical protein
MEKMKTPHDRFVKYLYARGKDPSRFIPDGLPIPPAENYGKLPRRGAKHREWLAREDLENLKDRIGLVFDLWHTPVFNKIMTILIMRNRDDLISSILQKYGRWLLSDDDIDLYKHLFFDVEGWNGLMHLQYRDAIVDTDIYLNYELAMGTTPYEVLLFDLGADAPPQSADDVLNRVLSVSYHEFERTDNDRDKREWGKFIFQMIKEKKKEKDTTTAQQVLEQLQMRLPSVAAKVHELGDDAEMG